MPETRHFVPPPGTTPRGRGWLPHGSHPHVEGQLVYAAAGALAMTTERGTRVAPANRVTWTPPGFAHSHASTAGPTPASSSSRPSCAGDLVAGCDGDRGVSRTTIPAGALTRYTHEFGYASPG